MSHFPFPTQGKDWKPGEYIVLPTKGNHTTSYTPANKVLMVVHVQCVWKSHTDSLSVGLLHINGVDIFGSMSTISR